MKWKIALIGLGGGGGGGLGLNILVFNCRGYYMLKWLFVVWLYSHAVFVVWRSILGAVTSIPGPGSSCSAASQ